MRPGKKIIIIAVLITAVIGSALFYVFTNIDSIVKAAIEKYGSQTTKTAVRVSAVKIKLSSGEGAVKGLTVANPSGFSSSKIFSLGEISVKIDVGSVTSDIVVIDSIVISAPRALYELNSSGASNINGLKKNIQASAKKDEKKDKGKEKRFLIRKLIIENGRINLRISSLGDKPSVIKLPRVERHNIGGKKGATPAQVADVIASAFTEEIAVAVAKAGVENIISGTIKKLFGR